MKPSTSKDNFSDLPIVKKLKKTKSVHNSPKKHGPKVKKYSGDYNMNMVNSVKDKL